MLTLRPEQMTALRRVRHDDFLARLRRHVETHFPDAVRGLGREGLRRTLTERLRRGRHHGFETERDLVKWVNLTFVLGEGFDRDPELPWAARILGNLDIGPTLKINRLYLAALERQERP